jgi:hypothetical protein
MKGSCARPSLVLPAARRLSQEDRKYEANLGNLARFQEAEITRIRVRSQPRQIVYETISKTNKQKRTAGGPEFNPQYHKNNK